MRRFVYGFLTCFLFVFLLDGAAASESLTLTGQIFPGKPDFQIDSPHRSTNSRPLAWLLVHGEMPGRHVYSLTQKKTAGGYPTQIVVSFPDEEGEFPFFIGDFVSATPIDRVPFMGSILEEWNDQFDILAPVYPRPGSPAEQMIPEEAVEELLRLAPVGKIDALCCDSNNCIPVRESISFSKGTEDKQILPLITAAYTADNLAKTESSHSEISSDDLMTDFFPETVSEEPPVSSDTEPAAQKEISAEPVCLESENGVFRNLIYAFLGGMILNIMPCVLPVIGLKIVSFFEQAGKSRSMAFWLNLCYSAGILTVFTVLALMSVGLSYLFTYGIFQIVMGTVVFAMALNLMGVWEIILPGFLGGEASSRLSARKGSLGGWIKGLITTLLAIPCGAPLLSPALVWTDALMKNGSVWSVLIVYWVIGLGMAAPFLVLGAFPELLKFLPKPGVWMETFKNMMGFLLLIAVIWILYSMPLPLILPMLAFLFAVWFACWYIGKNQFNPDHKPLKVWSIALAVLAAAGLFSFDLQIKGESLLPNLEQAFHGKLLKWGIRADRNGELVQEEWGLFDQKRFENALASGKTVIVDFTADWCMNCKVLEAAVLRSKEVTELIAEKEIITMTGDWTNRDDSKESKDIGDLLRRYGGEQVPVVMIFTAEQPDTPILLRGLFSKSELVRHLESL